MKENICIALVIYAIRSVLGFANYWIIFEDFFDFPVRNKKNNWIWLLFYVGVMLFRKPMLFYGPRLIALSLLLLYAVAIVPYLWSRYGKDIKILLIVLLYGYLVEAVSQNSCYLFWDKRDFRDWIVWKPDISITFIELVICLALMLGRYLKKRNRLRIYFTKLTISEYIIMFLLNFLYGFMQTYLFRYGMVNDFLKVMSIVVYGLLMVLFVHVIMVRDQQISMNSMIGSLKEPMEQITASYIEMDGKNTELRRFRHDTKNLLLALRAMLSEEKYEQAIIYLGQMQEAVDTIQSKMFDTGNFIADALLESKAKIAKQNEITMTVDGYIPANKVEDVDLVILISNLLDNAIEASVQIEGEKWIEVQSILRKNMWILQIKNTCLRDVVIRENYIETTKEDKESHGFGVLNVERVARKYNGKLQQTCKNNVFCSVVTVMLTK